MTASANSSGSVGNLNLTALPEGRADIARLIVEAFANAGFGKPQQLAAVANAIAEANLNPDSVSMPEEAVGLFQLNRTHGLGRGHSVAELKDPAINISIILSEAGKVVEFTRAASLEDAVSIFVRFIGRPANPEAQVARRLKIAEQIGSVD
jgi:hypothetical protein